MVCFNQVSHILALPVLFAPFVLRVAAEKLEWFALLYSTRLLKGLYTTRLVHPPTTASEQYLAKGYLQTHAGTRLNHQPFN